MLPKRKFVRWQGYDYSQSGYYFVTICTQNRKCMFIDSVGADRCVRPSMELTNPCVRPSMETNHCPSMENIHTKTKLNDVGKMIDYWWNELPKHFENIELDDYVIMPNHIHAIIIIRNDSCGRTHPNVCGATHRSPPTTLGNIIQWFKTMATNEYIRNVKTKKWPIFVKRIFQINYYEHVIKSEKRYLIIKNYIKNNPVNWENDILFQ